MSDLRHEGQQHYSDEQLIIAEQRVRRFMLNEDVLLGGATEIVPSLRDLLALREKSSFYAENKGVIDFAIDEKTSEERSQESDLDPDFEGFYEKQTLAQAIDSLMTVVGYADDNVDLRSLDIEGAYGKMNLLLRKNGDVLSPEEKQGFLRFQEKVKPIIQKRQAERRASLERNAISLKNVGFKEGFNKASEGVLFAQAKVDAEISRMPDAVKGAVYMGRLMSEYFAKDGKMQFGPPNNFFMKEVSFFKANRDVFEGFPDAARDVIEKIIAMYDKAYEGK